MANDTSYWHNPQSWAGENSLCMHRIQHTFILHNISCIQTGTEAQNKNDFLHASSAQHVSLEVCAIQDGARCHTFPAQIPGTVLSNLIAANLFPDPNIGVSHGSIPDIYHIGRDFYTYSFFTEFWKPHDWDAAAGCRALLTLHGINYSAWYAEAPLLHLHSLCLQIAM